MFRTDRGAHLAAVEEAPSSTPGEQLAAGAQTEKKEAAQTPVAGPAPASALDGRLASAFDVRALLAEKLALFKHGTREWAFKAVLQWLLREDAAAPKVFWLMGGAGTGKTVVSAELLRRLREAPEEPVAGEEPARSLAGRLGAAHFFRHDDATTSDPVALLRSLAAQLCASVPGFEAALAAEDVDAALQAVKVEDAFAALLAKPLAALPPRPADAPRQVIILDALDELSAQQLGPVLNLITTCLVTLPEWLRLFVTSRDEAAIKAKLCAAGLEPEEVSSTMCAACCVLLLLQWWRRHRRRRRRLFLLPFLHLRVCTTLLLLLRMHLKRSVLTPARPVLCRCMIRSCAWTRRATRRTCARTSPPWPRASSRRRSPRRRSRRTSRTSSAST